MARKRPTSAVARERRRRESAAPGRPPREPAATSRREAARTCGWCGAPLEVTPVGRIPKWCSAACRQRAWEQSRAAASGRSAVTVVERVIAPPPPRSKDWPERLHQLADHLDRRRIYPRDLTDLAAAFFLFLYAYHRETR